MGILLLAKPPPTVLQAGGAVFALAGGSASFSQSSPSGTLSAGGASFALGGGAATFSSGSGLILNFIPDTNWTNTAPASYVSALATAKSMIQSAFPNTNITINLTLTYNSAITTSGASGAFCNFISSASYASIKSAMAAIPSPTASLSAVLSHLPGSPSGGLSSFTFLSRAVSKLLGFTTARDASLDGQVDMGPGWGSGKLVGVFLHEISHAMGRDAGFATFYFSRFTAPGAWETSDGTGIVGSYFSLDGGTTSIAVYDSSGGGDESDFVDTFTDPGSGLTDSFDARQTNPIESLTTADIQLMNAMGYQ